LAVTEAADTAAFTAHEKITAALATTEAGDRAAFTAHEKITAALATTEAGDTAAFTAHEKITAALATTEAGDTAAFATRASTHGTLATTEAGDTAAFTAAVASTPLTGTNLAAKIVPFTTADAYATHDEQYGKGGYRTVASIAARNAIPTQRLTAGMIVYVDGDQMYRLNDDMISWTALPLFGSSVALATQVTTITNSITWVSGGVTLAGQTLAALRRWRIRAFGSFSVYPSGGARQFVAQAFWQSGGGGLGQMAVNLAAGDTGTFEIEVDIAATSSTAAYVANRMLINWEGSSANPPHVVTSGANVLSLPSGPQSVDLMFSMNDVVIWSDAWVVNGVTIERLA
jgi:hypothetical protein